MILILILRSLFYISFMKFGSYQLKEGSPPVPNQDDFGITEALAYMQRGLSASYDYSDLIYVVDDHIHDPQIKKSVRKEGRFMGKPEAFKRDIAQVYIDTHKECFCPHKSDLERLDQPEFVISSFDTHFWNEISGNKVKAYNLPWQREENYLDPDFPDRKKNFYKFNILALFQVKKLKKDQIKEGQRVRNTTTNRIIKVLTDHKLKYLVIEGQSREFCGVTNAIIGGRFNDGQEKPKDPYTFFLHCLVGYQNPEHLGGSYLIAQKCVFDWHSIHNNNESMSGTIGRNTINDGSTIFSQHHCPRSHIRMSRIKDKYGNPVTLHRQSKSFTTDSFNPQLKRGLTDNISPEEGLFFLGYSNDPDILETMYINQLGNNKNTAYQDGLLNHFRVDHGNILYTPNIFEITGFSLKRADIQPGVASLCEYHQTRWLKHYKTNEEDEEMWKTTGNHYYNYSRAGFLKKMSYAFEYEQDLDPPSPRILRLISKTFSLWQDTWYFDRKQPEMNNLIEYLSESPEVFDYLEKKSGFKLKQWKRPKTKNMLQYRNTYKKIPFVIRNGMAVFYNLAHLTSNSNYGCRGNLQGDLSRGFGANTFHIEPQDVLVGGQANLTFGQGKHVIQYLLEDEMLQNWMQHRNISGHSGIGHVLPWYEQILEDGLDSLLEKFGEKAKKYANDTSVSGKEKLELFSASIFALLGMKQYFLNYAQLAEGVLKTLNANQIASKKSLERIRDTMYHIASKPPIKPKITDDPSVWTQGLHQAAQLILSIFLCLHLTGEPISVGRLDYSLRNYVPRSAPINKLIQPTQDQQDIIDSFFLKVGQKANFNKGFFEDHQKWGNLAMGGDSGPYPQSASFNQWGMETVVGGTNPDGSPFYNVLTVACLRASRTVPVNAPCLGLRLNPKTPSFVIEQAAKTILSGGAHPYMMNDAKIVAGLRKSGDYKIDENIWKSQKVQIDGKEVDVPYNHWNPVIAEKDLFDFGSDGCHQFLPQGKSWFWLNGVFALEPLQYVINVGMNLISSGNQYIHGQRLTYRCRQLDTYTTFEELQNEYLEVFGDFATRNFEDALLKYENMPKYCPATLLNAFTADMKERQSDFYHNGANYRLFCPQITGIANASNALWNIRTLVFEKKVTTLEQIRQVLLVNWGDQLEEPFVPKTLPPIMKQRLKQRCDMLRVMTWRQPKFGIDKAVTQYGLQLSQRLSRRIRKIFEEPSPRLLKQFKTLTYKYASQKAPFGFQYLPGCGTFENYYDFGQSLGASFDGRKKAQSVGEDYAPQNFLWDKEIGDPHFKWKEHYLQDILSNYTHTPLGPNDPELFSGAVLDFNINEDYNQQILTKNIKQFSQGMGPNTITISVGAHKLLTDALINTDRDLLRFRMGGWSQFAVAMFPHLLHHHIRRLREISKPIEQLTQQQEEEKEAEQMSKPKKKVKK